jgi:hypothetical protein
MHVLSRQQRGRIGVGEARRLHETIKIGNLVPFQRSLPIALIHNYAIGNGALVRQELVKSHDRNRQRVRAIECRGSGSLTERRLVSALDEVSCLLKLNREEEGTRHVVTARRSTIRVRAARLNLVRPERETRCVRIAIKEVSIVLTNEEIGLVNWVVRGRISQTTRVGLDVAGNFAD